MLQHCLLRGMYCTSVAIWDSVLASLIQLMTNPSINLYSQLPEVVKAENSNINLMQLIYSPLPSAEAKGKYILAAIRSFKCA
jgi:hypothetical protein